MRTLTYDDLHRGCRRPPTHAGVVSRPVTGGDLPARCPRATIASSPARGSGAPHGGFAASPRRRWAAAQDAEATLVSRRRQLSAREAMPMMAKSMMPSSQPKRRARAMGPAAW